MTIQSRTANQLVAKGDKAKGDTAISFYTLAASIDPGNHAAYLGLATVDYSLGQPANALAALAKAGQGTTVSELTVESRLELGQFNAAAQAAAPLTKIHNDADLHLAALAYAAAGDTSQAQNLSTRISSPQAAQSASRASAGKLALAQELYVTGLLNASQAVLNSAPASYARNMLLARLMYQAHQKSQLATAANLVETAVFLNPASPTAHQLLAEIYRSQGLADKASQQDSLTQKLLAGQP
jgi:hypothetical protein